MKFAFIASLLTIFMAISVQSMTVRNHEIKRKNYQQAVSSFKTALENFSKCYKLKAKMMMKYRNRPRLARRIAKLTLEC